MPDQTAHLLPITPEELRARAGIVCVALAGADLLRIAKETARRYRFVEFRLDSLPDPSACLPDLANFLASHPQVTAIATCRRHAFGGAFQGTAEEQFEILIGAAKAGCELVDAEVETAEELGPDMLNVVRDAGAAAMLSWHDFSGTPDLLPVYDRLSAFQPDFVKIVPTAKTLTDSLRLLDLLEASGGTGRLVAMSMSFHGVLTRVLGPRYGSAFTFAAPDGNEGTAPGQVSAATLCELYRIEQISRGTALYAVAGSPIGASLSPLMHNTAFRAAGMDAVYLPLETADPQELQMVMQRLNIRGLSITMPLKETVLPLLNTREAAVTSMAACNTLLRQDDGTLSGFNTDVAGIVGPLEQRLSLKGKRVLILGAGGAARAAAFGLRERGAEVFLLNRTAARAEALAAESGAQVQPRGTLAATHFDILINSTPYGMRGKQIDSPISPDEMKCDLFFDLVYNPLETPLMLIAKEADIETIAGAAMFVAQGVRQYELWMGGKAPQAEMLQVVEDALRA
ncbi:MAG: shikimate dehydrogenase [Janthinobacterium lividum]